MEESTSPQPVTPGPSGSLVFSSYQIYMIVMLALLQFTVILDFMILSPLGDIVMKQLNMSTAQFGSVVSAYGISAGASGFLAAGFADRFDRKKMLLFFYLGFIVGTLFCGLAHSYETLFVARIITGVFGGVIGAISMAIITDIFNLQQRGRVMGFVQMAFAGSQILGVPVGLLVANAWGWNATFFMVVALALIVGLLVFVKMHAVTEHFKVKNDKSALLHLWHTVKRKDYRIGYMATAMLSMGGFMLMPFTTAFIVNNVHIAQEQLPVIFLFTGLSSMIIMPVIGKLSDRIDKVKLFGIGSIIAGVMVLVYTNLPPTPLWLVIAINMVLFMGIMSRMVPATALNSAVPGLSDRGAYMSVNSSLQQMAGGCAALFAGLIVVQPTKTSPLQNFDVLGYIMLGFFIWCFYLVRRVSVIVKNKT